MVGGAVMFAVLVTIILVIAAPLFGVLLPDGLSVLGHHIEQTSLVFIFAVGGFTAAFVVLNVLPSVFTWHRLGDAAEKLRRLNARHKDGRQPITFEDAEAALGNWDRLKRVWGEYKETLHEQHEVVDGETRTLGIRATVPAEMFFNPQVLVVTPTNSEFFKHLPGILTGIGIIGTFWHVIRGLHAFDPSMNPQTLNDGLKALVGSIEQAFIASLCAILAAMIVTLLEKLLLARCLSATEEVGHAIDGLYEAGVGEEYLADLVGSAKEGAAQTKQLKDSLVQDLKSLLTELTERQIAAAQSDRAQLVKGVSDGIAAAISPLSTIVERASGDQSQAVHGLLENLLAGFMAKIEHTLGSQMQGMVTLMQETATSIREMQGGFQKLVGDLVEAGDTSTEAMATKMAEAVTTLEGTFTRLVEALTKAGNASTANMMSTLTEMMGEADARQGRMNDAVTALLTDMRTELGRSQASVADGMKEAVATLESTVRALAENLADQSRKGSEAADADLARLRAAMEAMATRVQTSGEAAGKALVESVAASLGGVKTALSQHLRALDEVRQKDRVQDGARQEQLAKAAQSLIAGLGEKVGDLVSGVDASVAAMKQTVEEMGRVSRESVDGMRGGAETMRGAADSFTKASGNFVQALDGTRTLLKDLGSVTASLDATGAKVRETLKAYDKTLDATGAKVRETLKAYDQTRDSLGTMVQSLRGLMNDMDDRATLRRDVTETMRTLVDDFERLQAKNADYLKRVSEELNKGFENFGTAVADSMGKAGGEFEKALVDSVKIISGQIETLREELEGLETVLSNFNARVSA